MKKIFTLLFAALSATTMMAQMHGALRFAGASTIKVSSQNIENASDTVSFAMNDMTSGDITLPEMKGMATIPSQSREPHSLWATTTWLSLPTSPSRLPSQ